MQTPQPLDEKYPFSSQQLRVILETIPANVFFKDVQGRYQIVSHICDMLNQGSIVGKTDLEVQTDPALGKKFYEEDMEIVRTGKEMQYLQEMTFESGTYYYLISKSPVRDQDGAIIGVTGIIQDMTENIQLQKQLQYFSERDSMTGTGNRLYYNNLLEHGLPFAFPVGVIVADCNQLKYINDHFGHSAGDELLLSTVKNLRRHLAGRGPIIRLGGDEFLMLVPECTDGECERLIRLFQESESSILVSGIPLSTSYGYAVMHSQADSLAEAVDLADRWMYAAKAKYRQENP